MPFEFSMQRVLHITENEKKQLESEYQTFYQMFEQLANELLCLMKKKEEVQTQLQQELKTSVTVDDIKSQINYVENLEKRIEDQQRKYDQARERLESFQLVLKEKTIEIKKYEKLKSKKWINYLKDEKKREMKLMDETASLNFMRH
ncbi:flagellar export protein FliJ [Scopulibacillus cellulosilyticus]|uniref:Flagellar FliJ protein n=1 Tax=Scopulibacillus cellulosilyticus TaxID=2665665 RepID=A0ABW2PZ83_9BACL